MIEITSDVTIKVIPGPLVCGFDIQEELHVTTGNQVAFVNETENYILIRFTDVDMFGLTHIFLNPAPDACALTVKSGDKLQMSCTADCSYDPDLSKVFYEAKPTVVINRD